MQARSKRLRLLRRSVQIAFLSGFIFLAWVAVYPPSAKIPENLFLRSDPLSGALWFLSHPGGWVLALWPAWVILGLALLSGRFFCAWICPLGTCFDLLPSVGRSRRRRTQPRSIGGSRIEPDTRRFRVKYFLLLVLCSALVAGLNMAWLYDPLVIANQAAIFAFMGAIPWVFGGLAVMAMLYRPRFWCQELCPAGAIQSLVAMLGRKLPARLSPLALIKEDACNGCGVCARACPFEISDIAVSKPGGRVVLPDCALCGDCAAACPRSGTLRLASFGKTLVGGASGRHRKAESLEEGCACGN